MNVLVAKSLMLTSLLFVLMKILTGDILYVALAGFALFVWISEYYFDLFNNDEMLFYSLLLFTICTILCFFSIAAIIIIKRLFKQ